jgi:hypothetical protein
VYGYVGGNPVNQIDPKGQFLIAAPLVVGAAEVVVSSVASRLIAAGVVAALSSSLSRDSSDYGCGANRREDWCEQNLKDDMAQCKTAWKSIDNAGLAACNRSAQVRYGECLVRGGPHRITTPLSPLSYRD